MMRVWGKPNAQMGRDRAQTRHQTTVPPAPTCSSDHSCTTAHLRANSQYSNRRRVQAAAHWHSRVVLPKGVHGDQVRALLNRQLHKSQPLLEDHRVAAGRGVQGLGGTTWWGKQREQGVRAGGGWMESRGVMVRGRARARTSGQGCRWGARGRGRGEGRCGTGGWGGEGSAAIGRACTLHARPPHTWCLQRASDTYQAPTGCSSRCPARTLHCTERRHRPRPPGTGHDTSCTQRVAPRRGKQKREGGGGTTTTYVGEGHQQLQPTTAQAERCRPQQAHTAQTGSPSLGVEGGGLTPGR